MDLIDILYHERTFLIKELYIATIACIAVALFFGVVSACMAVINTASNPTEYICHMPGQSGATWGRYFVHFFDGKFHRKFHRKFRRNFRRKNVRENRIF
jgi:hypothetical protein